MSVLEQVSIGSLRQGAVPPGYTFTRSTTATYIDSDGLLKVAAINTPRRQWDAASRRWGYVGEPGRTNLCTYSEQFDNAAWTKTGTTVTANATTSPDGTSTMDLVQEDGTTNVRYAVQTFTKAASATTYSVTVFGKYSGRHLQIVAYQTSSFSNRAVFGVNLSTGAVGLPAAAAGTWTAASGTVESFGGGVYRVSLTFTTSTETDLSIRYYLDNGTWTNGGAPYAGDGASGAYLWGAQLEAGPYPTSYIPTTTGTVSRGADLLTRALTAGEGTALSAQGTMVVEFSFLGKVPSASDTDRYAICLDDASVNNRQWIGGSGTADRVYHVTKTSGSPVAFPAATVALSVGLVIKAASRFATNDVNVSANTAIGTADTTAAMPTLTQIVIGNGHASTGPLCGIIYGWTIYDDVKTDAELQALTSPTKRAVSHWRTLNGTHRTASSSDKTVTVALESECDLNPAGIGGINRVEFDYDVNGGTPTKITKTARELLTYNSTTGSLNNFTKLFCYGFPLDCAALAGGTITVRATVFGNNGGVYSVPSDLTIYNDTDGVDRRPSSAVVYYDYDNGNDSTGDGTLGNPFKNPRAAMNSLSGDVGGARIYALSQTVGMTATGSYSSSSWYTSGAWTLTFEAIGIVKTWRRLSPGSFTVPDDYILGVNNDNASRRANLRFVGYEFAGPGPSLYLAGPKGRIDEINCLMRSEKWTSSDTAPHVDYAQYGSGGVGLELSAGSTGQHFAWGCQWRGVAGGPSAYSGVFDFLIDKFLGVAIFTSNDYGVDPCITNGVVSGVRYVPGELDGLVQTNINFTQLAGANVAITVPSPGLMRIDAINGTPNDFGAHAAGLVGSTHWGLKVEFATSGGNNGTFPVVSSGTNGSGRPYVVVANASAVAEAGSASLDMNTARLSDGARYIDAVHTDILQMFANHDGAFFAHIRAIDCHNTRSWVGSGLNLKTCVLKDLTQGDSAGAFDFGSGSTTLLDGIFLSLSIDTTAISFTGTFTGTNFVDCVWGSGTNIPTTNTYLNGNHYVTNSAGGTGASTGAWFAADPAVAPFNYSPSSGNLNTASGLQQMPVGWRFSGATGDSRGAWRNIAGGNWSYGAAGASPIVKPSRFSGLRFKFGM